MKVSRRGLTPRPGRHRDARLLLVATEDRYAARQYLEALQDRGLIDRSRVHVHVLATEDSRSSPEHVLDRLLDLRLELAEADERWLVLDVDRWPEKTLASVCRLATQNGVGLAISNPCIEAWLLLHFEDGRPESPCQSSEEQLRKLLGTYNKTRIPTEPWTHERVTRACERAQAEDNGERWPSKPGSHVQRLIAAARPNRQAT